MTDDINGTDICCEDDNSERMNVYYNYPLTFFLSAFPTSLTPLLTILICISRDINEGDDYIFGLDGVLCF